MKRKREMDIEQELVSSCGLISAARWEAASVYLLDRCMQAAGDYCCLEMRNSTGTAQTNNFECRFLGGERDIFRLL